MSEDTLTQNGDGMDMTRGDVDAVAAMLGAKVDDAAPTQSTLSAVKAPMVKAVPIGAVPVDADADAEIERSMFSDGREFASAKTKVKPYTTTVKIGNTTFYVVELPQDLYQQFVRETQEIVRESRTMSKIVDDDERLAAFDAAAKRSVELNEWVIEKTVRDWSNPKWTDKIKCDAESRKALSPSTKAELCDLIVAKSHAGRGASGYL